MNNSVKLGIVATASFVAGYFVANWRNEQFYFDRANEEVEAVREEYEAKLRDVEKELASAQNRLRNMGLIPPDEAAIQEAAEVMMDVEAAEALSSYQGKGGFEPVDVHAHAPKIQYSDYTVEEAEKLQPRETETTNYAAKSAPPPKPEAKHAVPTENIEIITPDQFSEGDHDYDQPTYVYYRGQDILESGRVDEPGKLDDDLRKMLLGSRSDLLARDNFWEGLGDDAFYLRNHDLKVDIEIILADDELKYEESPGGNG